MVEVSFIVIAYNIEEYIEHCLESIINQKLENININVEIVFVDDGSTDKTLERVKKISKYEPRLKIITQQNKGANEARKTGFRNAEGQYIIFVDGDDWISEDFTEIMYKKIKYSDFDIVCCNYYLVSKNGKLIKNKIKKCEYICENKYLELVLKQKVSNNLWGKILKKDFIQKTEFMNFLGISRGEDLVDNILFAIEKPKVLICEEILYYYYQRETSTMNGDSSKLLEISKSLEYIENVLKKYDIYEKYKREIDFLWFSNCYINSVVSTRIRVDKNHRLIYDIWKNKKINIKNNDLCKDYIKFMSLNRRIIKILMDFNYYLGAFVLKVEYKIRNYNN